MYDKAKTRRKIIGMSLTAVLMAGLLYAYDIQAAVVERGVHAVVSTLSPARYLKERAIKAEFARSGSPSAPETGSWKGVPVLLYHGIVRKPDRFNMTEAVFKDQMFALKRAGYRTATLREFRSFMRGETELPAKSFLLSFDDGRSDSYENADPVLRALGYNAVMFVATGASMPSEDVRWAYYISPNDIKDMLDSGRWEIGSHAVQDGGGFVDVSEDGRKANFLSSRMWLAGEKRLENQGEYATRVAHELGDSKRTLERAFAADIDAFSYPFGDYGQQSKNNGDTAAPTIRRIIGGMYGSAFRQVWPEDGEYAFNHAGDDAYRLKRIETPTDWTGAQLVSFLWSAREKDLPYRDDLSGDAGWHGTWGDVRFDDGGLTVAATGDSAGAAAFLDGARTWKDYAYAVRFEKGRGSHVSLMARYEDSRNYLVCTFGGDRVKIERIIDGAARTLADVRSDVPLPGGETAAGMRVRGAQVECLSGATTVVSATAADSAGGIGIRVWDQELDNASIVVKSVDVTALD